jgi:hypothetical protein
MATRRSPLDDDCVPIEDDDGGVESDGDICDRRSCECPRSEHENGKGACACGRCKKFKEPS